MSIAPKRWTPGWYRIIGWDEYRFAHQVKSNTTQDVAWVDLGVAGSKFVNADAFIVSAHRVYEDLWVAEGVQFEYGRASSPQPERHRARPAAPERTPNAR